MSLTLYVGSKRYSSWSLRPYVALAHTGAQFDSKTIWLDKDDTQANIAKVTPAGRVPVLHHDDLIIWDSLAICEYVNELVPGRQTVADRSSRACQGASDFVPRCTRASHRCAATCRWTSAASGLAKATPQKLSPTRAA